MKSICRLQPRILPRACKKTIARRKAVNLVLALTLAAVLPYLFCASAWPACDPRTPYQETPNLPLLEDAGELKELRLETAIVESWGAGCNAGSVNFGTVVVTPDGRYDDYLNDLVVDIGPDSSCPCGGLSVPIPVWENYSDSIDPKQILASRNVIALGNMETNAFIRKLYYEWYVLLDLKYPGEDGYVIRTLHDPYGTGRNVIFLGGSSYAGVGRAVARFREIMDLTNCSAGNSFAVPRLMEIELGDELRNQVPVIGVDIGYDIPWSEWNVHSWRDSWRVLNTGETTGYEPATVFGWNPISISGLLYYMTGNSGYLEIFKKVARIPESPGVPTGSLPEANISNPAFYDPENPLVDSYGFYTHLLDIVYDLIEESPDFDDDDRLFVTNKLIQHQDFLDPDHTKLEPHPDRICAYDMMNIYTGSRYFAKYYPGVSWNVSWADGSTVWEKRMGNVRQSFESLIGDPTWGVLDTRQWVSTYTEVVFDFFILDGFEKFVEDPGTGYQTAETMMSIFDIMRTGWEHKNSYENNANMTINLLNKAARILNDDRYLWMLNELGEKTEIRDGAEVTYGFDLNRFRIGRSFWHPDSDNDPPPTRPTGDMINEAAYFSLADTDWNNTNIDLPAGKQSPKDDSFQLLSFRSGNSENDNFLQIDGFYGGGRNTYHLNTIYWLRMFGIPVLWWYENDVDILYNGMSTLNPPRCTALNQWDYEASRDMLYLQTEVPNMPESKWKRHILCLWDDAAIVVDQITADNPGQFDITCTWSLWGFYNTSYSRMPDFAYRSAGKNMLLSHSNSSRVDVNESVYTVRQRTLAELDAGENFTVGNVFSQADSNSFTIRRVVGQDNAFVLSRDGIRNSLIVLGRFSSGGFSVNADFAFCDGTDTFLFNEGMETDNISSPANFLSILNGLEIQEPSIPEEGNVDIDWTPTWQRGLGTEIDILKTGGGVWVAGNSQIHTLNSRTGELIAQTDCPSPILSLWPARNATQAEAFDVLAGFEDSGLTAYKDGTEIWNVITAIPEEVIRLNAPWFATDMSGVHSIFVDDLWNTGEEMIAVGQASTVELRNPADGALLARLPSLYGKNTSLGLLTDVEGYGRVLVAGKSMNEYPKFSGIVRNYDGTYENAGNNLFYETEDGETAAGESYVSMHAFIQNDVEHSLIADIDNDGKEEIVYTLSGHWNELRVHRGDSIDYDDTARPEWLRYFGGAAKYENFMKGLSLIPRDDGTKAVITATRDGRIGAFDAFGNILWMKTFARDISCMETFEPDSESPQIAVGFDNGMVTLLDKNGATLKNAQLDSAPVKMATDRCGLYCGGSDGKVSAFRLASPTAASLVEPVPGSQLDSSTAEFFWDDTCADEYWLRIGTAGPGSSNIYSNSRGTATSETVSGLPESGETVYVRLSSSIDGEWIHNDYIFRAFLSLDTNLSLGLAGHWEFDETGGNTAIDSTGNGHDGAIRNHSGASWARTDGISESGVDFTDGENYVAVPDDGSFSMSGNLTVSAWVKLNGFNSCIVHKAADSGQNRLNYQLEAREAGFVFRMGNSAGSDFILYSTSYPATGRWYHLAGVYDGQNIYIYVDGVLENGKYTGSFTPHTGPADLVFGSDNLEKWSNAVVDNVRIYNSALTGSEIRTLFDFNRPHIYVDASAGGIETGGPDFPYNTIGEAVLNASDHTTIRVAKGSYAESPAISNTGVRIESGWNNGAGVWHRDSPVNPNDTRIFGGSAPASLRIENASGIVVDGFTIFGSGTGIAVSNSDNVTLTSNIVNNTATSPDAAGIKYAGSGGRITKNRVHTVNPDHPAYGIVLEDVAGFVDIDTNTVYPQSYVREVCVREVGANATPRKLVRNELYTDGRTVLYRDANGKGDIIDIWNLHKDYLADIMALGGNSCKRVRPYSGCHSITMWTDDFDMNFVAGWNLISLPLTSVLTRLSDLFPDAEIAYAYDGSTHVRVWDLEPGQGYWVKMPEAKTCKIYGIPFFGVAEPLPLGWHLKGVGFNAVTPQAVPATAWNEEMFVYDKNRGYVPTASIAPGQGFWVKILEPCSFDMESEQVMESSEDH